MRGSMYDDDVDVSTARVYFDTSLKLHAHWEEVKGRVILILGLHTCMKKLRENTLWSSNTHIDQSQKSSAIFSSVAFSHREALDTWSKLHFPSTYSFFVGMHFYIVYTYFK